MRRKSIFCGTCEYYKPKNNEPYCCYSPVVGGTCTSHVLCLDLERNRDNCCPFYKEDESAIKFKKFKKDLRASRGKIIGAVIAAVTIVLCAGLYKSII